MNATPLSDLLTVVLAITPPARGTAHGVTGPERRAANIVARWHEVGIKPVICYPRRGKLWSVFEGAGEQLFDLEIENKFDRAFVAKLAQVAKQTGAAVIHTQGPPSLDMLALWAARRCGVKAMSTRPVMIEYEMAYTKSRRWLYNQVDRFTTLSKLDLVVAVSNEGARYLADQRLVTPACLRTIHNGVDLRRFSVKVHGASDGTQGHPPVVLGMVGCLLPYKGWPDFIDTIAALRGKGINVRAISLGEGAQRAELEALIAARGLTGIVELRGYNKDVRTSLQEMDVFLFPSHREGLAVAIIEAMASGLPVVATDCGGVGEQVVEGQNGNMLPVSDIDGLTAACEKLVRDPALRAAYGKRSREVAEERFSEDRMLKDYAACYRELAAGKRCVP
jgi:glycosyltransferase involved in cell wall biosynthesis